MTDFTDTINTTGEQVEDLQQDLENHLEDILGVDVNVPDVGVDIDTDPDYPPRLSATVDLEDELVAELEDRLGAAVSVGYLSVNIELEQDETDGAGDDFECRHGDCDDMSEHIDRSIRERAREEAEELVSDLEERTESRIEELERQIER